MRIIALFLLVAAIGFGVAKAFRDGGNRIEDWLPTGAVETENLHWFRDHFGSDSFLMISWDGCEVGSSVLSGSTPAGISNQLAEFGKLLRLAARDESSPKFFSQVITGDEAIEQLSHSSIGLTLEQARQRMQGWMIGVDGVTTCLLAVLSDEGVQHDREAVDSISRIAAEILGPDFDWERQLYIAGPAMEALEIERSSHQFLVPLNLACYIVCASLMLITFRCPRVTAIVLLNAIASQLLLLAAIGYSPWCRLDAILLIAPSFMFVITVSGAIHVVNYYRDQLCCNETQSVISRTLRSAAAPTLLAAVTTCIGLLSLVISSLAPVRNFGLYSALGVVMSLVLLATIPWQLRTWKPTGFATPADLKHRRDIARCQWLTDFVRHRHAAILVVSVLVMGLGAWGVSRIHAKIRMHDFFLPNSKLNRDYEWLQQKIGPLGPIEIVIRIPKSLGLPVWEQLELVQRLADEISLLDGVASTASGATFAPALETLKPSSLRAVARQTLLKKRVGELQANLQEMEFLQVLASESLWRITARAYSNDRVDYGPLCNEIQMRLAGCLATRVNSAEPPITYVVTGGVPVVQKAQDLMLRDLVNSFLCALVLITVSHIILFLVWAAKDGQFTNSAWASCTNAQNRPSNSLARSVLNQFAAGCLSMLPNVLPVLIVFGVIGALGIEVGIGSMLTASVAMGVSVDDTLHFLTWYRRALASGKSRAESVKASLVHCSTAMIQTTAVFVLGLAVFTLSPYLPTARYAGIICSMLTIALVNDLIVLPAILLSSMGYVFCSPSQCHAVEDSA